MIGKATSAVYTIPRRWFQQLWGYASIHTRQKWMILWPHLSRLPCHTLYVLDAGCGTGIWTLELAARRPNWQILGIDKDKQSLQKAEASRRKLSLQNVAFVQADFQNFHIAQRYDVILSVASAHYLVEAGAGAELFAAFRSWLKDGGILFLLGPRQRAEAPFCKWLFRPQWRKVFSQQTLLALSQDHDLSISQLYGCIGYFGTLAKQIDWSAQKVCKALSVGLYPLEIILLCLDRWTLMQQKETLMWLLKAQAIGQNNLLEDDMDLQSHQEDLLPCWCGEDSWYQVFRTRHFGLLRCSTCRSYRIDPPPIQSNDESAEFYTAYYQRLHKSNSRTEEIHHRTSRFWRVVDQVPVLETPGNNVIDLGCGDGHLCAELQAAGWLSVVGIDVSRNRIARARQSYPQIDFYDQQIDTIDIGQQSVDLIVMDNVVEHLPDPIGLLQQLYQYLKPDGKIVLITPNMESGHFRLLGRRWTPELAPHAHIFLFTSASLYHLMAKADFVVESQGNFHLSPLSWRTWIHRLMRGDVKGWVWSAMQETGAIYGRLIKSGPMLYTVASPRSATTLEL